jgi:hypothetical protein
MAYRTCVVAASMLLVIAAASSARADVWVDSQLTRAVEAGDLRSPTFQQLRRELRESAWDLFIQIGRCPASPVAACLLHFVGRFRDRPYLRLVVDGRSRHPAIVSARIAHEMQHAREVIGHAHITSGAGITALFRRIGFEQVVTRRVTTYETRAAIQIEEQVLRELTIARRTRDHRTHLR